MAPRNSWDQPGFTPYVSAGFTPYVSPLPDPVTPKKSPQEQLDAVDEQIATLEEKREELRYEVAKEEVLRDAEHDEEVHKNCPTEQDIEDARAEGDEEVEEAWGLIREFGGHTATCLSGALVGSQALHPLCTCGWNEVATRLERR